MKKILVCMTFLFGAIATTFAQKPAVVVDNDPGWKRIGQVTASFKTTSESIVVLGADEFQAIKLKVKDAPVQIDRVQVFYESGDMEEVQVASKLNAGAETRVINLSNPKRDIQKVAFTYRTIANADGDKADVELYGLKTGTEGDAYRDSKVDEKVDNAGDEVRQESNEAREEVREEANEVRQETNEAKEEAREEANEIKRDADRTGDEVERDMEESAETVDSAANHVGDKISEAAAKTAAEIADKRHETKVGPDGQTIYIDKETRYYYINAEGKKVYVTKVQLKDKPDND